MPSLIEGEARQAVKRAVPKSSNKIHAAGVARLYIAHPDKHQWTYSGLQGAVVLANDLVGNTFWLKLVDISPSNRGVIWDQEIYDTFAYNQDRIFFHTFELEECLAGLSFADDKEAKQFKKKMDEREKNAHRNTKSKPFGVEEQHDDSSQKHHSRLGGIGRSLLPGHRHSSAPHQQAQSVIPRKEVPSPNSKSNGSILEDIDPTVLKELLDLGLTKDQLIENADFIKSYIEQRQAQPAPSDRRQVKAPAPAQPLTPQDTGNTATTRRGLPPPAPPARNVSKSESTRPPSPPSDNEPSPARSPALPPPSAPQAAFRVPPPIADAGKFAHVVDSDLSPTSRPNSSSNVQQSTPGPPPPPRPPKTPLEEDRPSQVFGVPPPFSGDRKPVPPPSRSSGGPPPPPPARRSGTSGPPPPPPRDTSAAHAAPPPLPPKTPNAPPSTNSPPPLPPGRDGRSVPPPPPMPARNDPPVAPPMPSRNDAPAPPPPPPMPTRSDAPPPPPPMPSRSNAPPPPPLPPSSSDAPAAPALPPGMTPVTANAPSAPPSGHDGLLSDIRGGAKLKKVSDSEKRDRSAAVVSGGGAGGGEAGGASGAGSAAPAGESGGLAGALAAALAERKSKVSQSDDEDDKDDW